MIKPKRRRADLSVPPYVAAQWNKGPAEKDEMADLLLQHNGVKDSYCKVTWFCSPDPHMLQTVLLPGCLPLRVGADDNQDQPNRDLQRSRLVFRG